MHLDRDGQQIFGFCQHGIVDLDGGGQCKIRRGRHVNVGVGVGTFSDRRDGTNSTLAAVMFAAFDASVRPFLRDDCSSVGGLRRRTFETSRSTPAIAHGGLELLMMMLSHFLRGHGTTDTHITQIHIRLSVVAVAGAVGRN
jgi:hypothetical protein